MAFVNNHHKPEPVAVDSKVVLDPTIPYDLNCYYTGGELKNDKIKLVPFVPAIFAKPFFKLFQDAPQAFPYLSYGPWPTFEDFLLTEESLLRRDPAVMHWAVLDLTKPAPTGAAWGEGQLAGGIAILNTVPARLSTEISHVLIHPSFQRTHITTNAVGLLLHWCFGTLKMRRVQWFANAKNERSIRLAKRMRFALEGILMWDRVLPQHKEDIGVTVERNGKLEAPGRHSALLAIGWDQWESGLMAQVQKEMDRSV